LFFFCVGLHWFGHGLPPVLWKQIASAVEMKTFASSAHDANKISSLSVFTLIVWLGCLLVGGLGFALPYVRPRPPQAKPEPMKAEMLEVKLTDDAQPVPEPDDNSAVTKSDPLTQQIPQPTPVAQPSPAIAFAIPVRGPVRIVPVRQAADAQSSSPAVAAVPEPQALTFGQGEGRQPKPEYPDRARREGQTGPVTVRFTVAEDGHVVSVEPIVPSRWPLLNQSVLRAVKQQWHFAPGKLRVYDVMIRFEFLK
jgi:TonB family protein